MYLIFIDGLKDHLIALIDKLIDLIDRWIDIFSTVSKKNQLFSNFSTVFNFFQNLNFFKKNQTIRISEI